MRIFNSRSMPSLGDYAQMLGGFFFPFVAVFLALCLISGPVARHRVVSRNPLTHTYLLINDTGTCDQDIPASPAPVLSLGPVVQSLERHLVSFSSIFELDSVAGQGEGILPPPLRAPPAVLN
jgi:hypothetical protein